MIRFYKFIMGSGLGAAIDFTLTLFLVEVLHWADWLSLGTAMIISATTVFYFHNKITFSSQSNSGLFFHKLVKFFSLAILVYLLRIGMLYLLDYFSILFVIKLAITLISISVINFILSKKLVFIEPEKPEV